MHLQILELFNFKHRWSWCSRTNILRTENRIMKKNLCHKTNLRNWTYITNNAFWRPLPAVDFSAVIGKKLSFWRNSSCGHLADKFVHTAFVQYPSKVRSVNYISKIIHEMTEAVYSHRAVLSNGPAGPGPSAPKAQGPPNSPYIIFLSREIIVTNCVIFHWPNK